MLGVCAKATYFLQDHAHPATAFTIIFAVRLAQLTRCSTLNTHRRMLLYSLVDNPLTVDNKEDCRAQVQDYTYRQIEDIVNQITVPGSILKDTECVAVINAFLKAITANLEAGIGFECDYLALSQSIAGVFVDKNDRFDANRHRVRLNLRVGEPTKAVLKRVPVSKVKANVLLPEPEGVYDRKSRTTDQIITAGHSADLTGERLKIENTDDPQQGVFLVNTQKKEEIKITYLHQNTAKTLQVEWPDTLKSGQEYRLEVRTTINGSQAVRTGTRATLLTVK